MNIYLDAIENIFFIIGLFVLVFCLVIIIYLVDKASMSNLLKKVPSTLKRDVYAYLDNKGRFLSLTQLFFEKLNIYKKQQSKWNKIVSNININGKDVSFADFEKFFIHTKEKDFNITFTIDGEVVTLPVQMLSVDGDDEQYGYILVSPQEGLQGFDGFLKVMDDLYNPFAYFNGKLDNINFTLNKNFQSKLRVKKSNMNYGELRKYVFEDDLDIFDSSVNELTKSCIHRFHLKTNLGLELFEEVKTVVNEEVVILITLLELDDTKDYLSQKELVKSIDELLQSNAEFGGVMISLNSLMQSNEELGNNVCREMGDKYISLMKKELLKGNDLICKVNDFEFIFVIKDIEDFDRLVSNANKEISSLLQYELDFGEKSVTVKNKLGFVYSKEYIKTTNDFLNALDTSLSFANNEGYEKDYSIYSQKKQENSDEYSFEKIKIDLDNSFLNDGE